MDRSPAKFFLLLMAAAATWSFFLVANAGRLQPSCIGRERDALLAFKQGMNDTYGELGSWQRGHQDCCQWAGITCNNVTGHVVKLELGERYLVGQISPSLLSLEHLEYLDLNWTRLYGPDGRVPVFLGSLKNLRHLDLSGMPFSGRVPPQLGNLSKLEYLDLSGNYFTGAVPPQLGNLSKLEYLDLSAIYFNNTRMVSTDISWLTRLPLLALLVGFGT
uniref:Somatic embryogenesis receptor kinase 1 n=1 Tax=Aegilops tauschii TaxID=37682 RepID=M8BGJ1_AEGTA